jgi:hypothetical protein
MLKPLIFIIISSFLTLSSVKADNTIVQVAMDGISTSDVPVKARTDSLQDALNKGCLQVIGNLIGQVKLEKNLSVISSKILSQTGKFVQFYKASEPVTKGNQTVTSVTMKISVSSLRDLLAQQGLLYQSEGPATILPIIKIVEKKDNGRQYTWWSEEVTPKTQFLRDEEKSVIHLFDGAFRPKNFYVIDPVTAHYVQWLPADYRTENLSQEQLLWFGEFFRGQIVVTGDVTIEPGTGEKTVKLSTRIVGYHTSNGRIVGEVARSFEVPYRDWDQGVHDVLHKAFSEITKDLSSQVSDESTRGTLGATVLRVTLRGNYNYQDLENFKKQVITKMGDVKAIRERLQERGLTSFELDYGGDVNALVKSLQANSFEGFKIAVQNSDNNEVNVRWSK